MSSIIATILVTLMEAVKNDIVWNFSYNTKDIFDLQKIIPINN